ncbi:integumentary mucin C.1-like [Macrobrachium rosenbergii]|uniref:integumentary mucin C.1-like n=1 Tax=Macrobrachium rosenbergii TaxID=79674 RepID=UPI0034D44D6E
MVLVVTPVPTTTKAIVPDASKATPVVTTAQGQSNKVKKSVFISVFLRALRACSPECIDDEIDNIWNTERTSTINPAIPVTPVPTTTKAIIPDASKATPVVTTAQERTSKITPAVPVTAVPTTTKAIIPDASKATDVLPTVAPPVMTTTQERTSTINPAVPVTPVPTTTKAIIPDASKATPVVTTAQVTSGL